MTQYKNIPLELRSLPRWVARKGKIPIDPNTGKQAKANDSNTWGTYDAALRAAKRTDGIGFELGDGIVGVDLDTVRDPATGELAPDARAIIDLLDSYTELSPSGYGVHILIKASGVTLPSHKVKLPQNGIHRESEDGKKKAPELEVYDSARYFTMTGSIFENRTELCERSEQLKELVSMYLVKNNKPKAEIKPVQASSSAVYLLNEELLAKIHESRQGAYFRRLWDGDLSACNGDHSSYDMALCNILAYWTARDAQRIDELFRLSALYRPEKWDKPHYADGRTYGQATVDEAISKCKNIYDPQGFRKKKQEQQLRRVASSEAAESSEEIKINEWVYTDEKGNLRIDKPMLADYMRQSFKYIFARDSARGTRDIYVYRDGVYSLQHPEDFKGEIKEFIPRSAYSSHVVDEVYKDLITTAYDSHLVDISQLNADENVVNFRNGLLYLDTMELRPHTPEILSTIQIPCDYKPLAECENKGIFDSFIDHHLGGDREQINLMLEFLGVAISNVDASRLKKALFVVGDGDTGKSQLKALAERLIGSQHCAPIELGDMEERFGPATLYNKRLAGCSDMRYMHVGELANFKKITGGDGIQAEFKGKPHFTFKYRGVLWFCMNRLPLFGGDRGDWVYNRICVIRAVGKVYSLDTPPFEGIVYRDPYLIDKLLNEREYIVSLAMSALQGVIKRGYEYSIQKKNLNELAQYRTMNDYALTFLEECCVERPNGKVYDNCDRPTLWRVFCAWCKDNCRNGYRCPRKEFNEAVALKGWEQITTINGKRYYKTFTLSQEAKTEYAYVYGYDGVGFGQNPQE